MEDAAERMSEAERLQHLASQSRFALPNGFADVSVRPEWASQKSALAAWQNIRRHLPMASEDHFFTLTCYLHRKHALKNEQYLVRALLESTVEATTKPIYRQLLRCMLARNAARLGDVVAANDWLAPCNARPLDLYMESAYRLSLAAVDTTLGNFQRVLALLGQEAGVLPIASSYEDLCDLYRANALEQMGYLEAAIEQLRDSFMGFRRPKSNVYIAGYFSGTIVMFMVHQDIGLCANSFPEAYKRAFRSNLHDVVTWDPVEGSVSMRAPLGAWLGMRGLVILLLLLPIIAGIITIVAVTIARGR